MRKILITFTLALATGVASLTAQASCFVSSQIVERVLAYETYGYIYFRPEQSLTNTTYYYVRTTSNGVLAAASAAQANRTTVNALGDATSCPTTGTARYMGNSTYLYLLN